MIEIKPNILEAIEYLFNKDLKMCIISNCDIIDIMGWDSSPLKQYFHEAVLSFKVKLLKPDRKIYQLAIDKMNTVSEKSLFIGDGGSNEFIGAKSINMDTLMTTEFIQNLWSDKLII